MISYLVMFVCVQMIVLELTVRIAAIIHVVCYIAVLLILEIRNAMILISKYHFE